jgi:hypothetical protein
MTHLLACIWVIVGKYDGNPDHIANNPDFSKDQIYITTFYFIITTITTVGYGDMSAGAGGSRWEQIINCFIMFIGTIAFAFASGLFTNAIL